nr:hypothetical protein [Morchella crassipes]
MQPPPPLIALLKDFSLNFLKKNEKEKEARAKRGGQLQAAVWLGELWGGGGRGWRLLRRRAVAGAMAANFSDSTADGANRSSGTSFPVNTDSGDGLQNRETALSPHTYCAAKIPPVKCKLTCIFTAPLVTHRIHHFTFTVEIF